MSIQSTPHLIKTTFVNITTLEGVTLYNAVHFYGKIHFFTENQKPELNQKITDFKPELSCNLERVITLLDAKKLDRKDNGKINVQMYERGYNLSIRHDSIEQVINSAIDMLKSMNINVPIFIFHQGTLKNPVPISKIENVIYSSKINYKIIAQIVQEYNSTQQNINLEEFISEHPHRNHIITL